MCEKKEEYQMLGEPAVLVGRPAAPDTPDPVELELLNDPEFMESFKQAKKDRDNGVFRKWEDIKRNV